MTQPNPTKIRELANIFLTLAKERPEAEVNMQEPDFHPCRTVACHAGWFAISRGEKEIVGYDFMDAADEMARFLGIDDHHKLKDWAKKNPELWGNRDGYLLFGDRRAFGLQRREPTLKEIGEHWLGVANRIEGLK